MTKETKIGLLVGLAFIILFAIILSEKGATRGTKSPSSLTIADASRGKNDRFVGGSGPLGSAGKLPVDTKAPSFPANVRTNDTQTSRGDSPSGTETSDSLPQFVIDALNGGGDRPDEEPEAAPGSSREETTSLANAVAKAVAGSVTLTTEDSVPAKPGSMPEPVKMVPENKTEMSPSPAVAGSRALENKATEKPAENKTTEPAVVHKVEPGQSVSKIAAKYYGRSTPDRVEAICKANRDVLKNAQTVRAGDNLKIPALEGFEPAPGFLGTGAPKPAPKAARPETVIPPPVETAKETRVADNSRSTAKPALVPVGSQSLPTMVEAPSSENMLRANPPVEKKETTVVRFQWYEVQKSDTMAKIAKRMLGSEKRTSDLCQINRDIVPDPTRLKSGTKIRVPVNDSGRVSATVLHASAGEP